MTGSDATGWQDAELASLRMEALEHLNHLFSGHATDRDAAGFTLWRAQSPAHEAALQSALRLRDLVRQSETDAAVATAPMPVAAVASIDDARDRRQARLYPTRRMMIGGSMAACVAGGVLATGRSLDLLPDVSALRADYRTRTGERRRVTLAAGATAELNTRTSIALRDDMGMPAIDLIDGEVIMTNAGAARAAVVGGRGTSIGSAGAFNARREADRVCITCLAGRVDVAWAGETRTVRPMEQLRYDDTVLGEVTAGADPAVATAWRSGTLIFNNMPMRQVVAELNRYRPGRIYLMNQTLAARPLSGTYDVRRLDDFFDQAEVALAVRVTRLPAGVIILS